MKQGEKYDEAKVAERLRDHSLYIAFAPVESPRIALAVLVVLFGVVGYFAIPKAVRWGLETVASRELGRTVKVESVSANPFTLRATMRGVVIDGAPGETAPLLSVREVIVNASSLSLYHRAPVLDALTVDGLTANLVRLEDQRFNFSDDRIALEKPHRMAVPDLALGVRQRSADLRREPLGYGPFGGGQGVVVGGDLGAHAMTSEGEAAALVAARSDLERCARP